MRYLFLFLFFRQGSASHVHFCLITGRPGTAVNETIHHEPETRSKRLMGIEFQKNGQNVSLMNGMDKLEIIFTKRKTRIP